MWKVVYKPTIIVECDSCGLESEISWQQLPEEGGALFVCDCGHGNTLHSIYQLLQNNEEDHTNEKIESAIEALAQTVKNARDDILLAIRHKES